MLRLEVSLAAREGFESVEHVKRYTALGFGTDQALSNVNGMAILANALGKVLQKLKRQCFGRLIQRHLCDSGP